MSSFVNGYDYKKTITIDHTQIPATFELTDFPVLINHIDADLADTANGGKVESPDGDDIRFELQPWNIITAYENSTTDISANVDGVEGIFFSDSGDRMYAVDFNNPSSIEEYTLSTPWDITTKTHSHSLDVSGNEFSTTGVYIGDNGTKLFIGGNSSNSIWMYNLSTAWDLSTATYSGDSFSVATQATIYGMNFKPDGTKFYIADGDSFDQNVVEYSLSTAWDVTTASHASSTALGSEMGGFEDVAFNSDGTKMYTLDVTGELHSYSITAWDSSTAVYDNISRYVETGMNVWGMFFQSNGGSLFVVSDAGGGTVKKFVMSEVLDHEIDRYVNTTGELIAHIRIPSLHYLYDSDIDMYYGNSGASNGENAAGVWSDYGSVFHLKDEGKTPIAEWWSTVPNNTIDGGTVSSVTFRNTYTNPVVVAFMVTFIGAQSVGVRAKNVTSTGCDIFMQEHDREAHTSERIAFMVMEAGTHVLPGGAKVEAGITSTSKAHTGGSAYSAGESVAFTEAFSSAPAVLHTLDTYNNSDFMTSIAHDISTTGMEVQQEAGEATPSTATEDIAWIAIEPTTQDWFEAGVSTAGSNCGVDDTPHTISFNNTYNAAPAHSTIVSQNSNNGVDGSWARAADRYDGNASNNYQTEITVYAEEVDNGEQAHTAETFGHITFFTQSGIMYAEDGAFTDSTGNSSGHTAFYEPNFEAGAIGEATDLETAVDNYIRVDGLGSPMASQTTFTLSGWIKMTGTDKFAFIAINTSSGGNELLFMRNVSGGNSINIVASSATTISGSDAINDDSWHYLAYSNDGSSGELWIDGVSQGTHSYTSSFVSSMLWSIGQEYDAGMAWGDNLLGSVDEIRIATVNRSSAWVVTEYNNQNSPATFYSVGTEETPPSSNLVPADISHGHTLESISLTEHQTIALADMLHSQLLDAVIITQKHGLTVDSLNHLHSLDGNLALVENITLAVDELFHSHTLESTEALPPDQPVPDELLHAHSLEGDLVLFQKSTLDVAGLSHLQALDSLTVTQKHSISTESLSHLHALDSLSVSQAHTVALEELLHAHTVDGVVLTQKQVLAVQDALHAMSLESPDIYTQLELVVEGLTHQQTLEEITILIKVKPTPHMVVVRPGRPQVQIPITASRIDPMRTGTQPKARLTRQVDKSPVVLERRDHPRLRKFKN